ncbi:MAG TPA: hypothetical protein VJ462_00105, partial [Thermodesulfobacteriota bacterium]|nr:hypothetical protein [Thermodesulfobacteriota bacterium]
YQCISCSHASSVPSDPIEGFGREKLNSDPSPSHRLTHSILAKEGERNNLSDIRKATLRYTLHQSGVSYGVS